MTIESILTDKEIHAHMSKIFGHERASSFLGGFALARAIEQAVLQSEQVQAWKRDSERYRAWREAACNVDIEFALNAENHIASLLADKSDKPTSDQFDAGIDAAMEQQT